MSRAGALAGLRVLDLADEKGAYCGKLLADMGADVVRIEPPGGDATRAIPPFLDDLPGAQSSLFFLYTATSKRGVTLDLTRPPGRDLLLRLAATADVVVESFAPGHLDGLGLGWAVLHRESPRLILTSITGFGQTGPHSGYATSDLVAAAMGGALYVTGEADGPPMALAGSPSWFGASTYAAVSTMIALRHRASSGLGQHVDVSAQETTASIAHICGVGRWLDDGIVPRRSGSRLVASTPSGAYPCKDGFVYLTVNRPRHWSELARWIHEVTGNDAVLDPLFEGPSAHRQPYREMIDAWVEELTSRLTVEEAFHEGQRRHVAFAPVRTASEVTRDAQLVARGYFVPVEHPEAGELRVPGAPYRPGATPWRIARPAPRLGEHNDEVFRGELGLSAQELRALEAAGIV